jgi:non-ribosomal peptide synthetase component F
VPRDRVLQFASIGFDASAEEIYPCLTSGATLVLRDDEMLRSGTDFVAGCRAAAHRRSTCRPPSGTGDRPGEGLDVERRVWPPDLCGA